MRLEGKEDKMNEEVIKRVLEVDVDGLRGTVTYIVMELYNVVRQGK